ncbi:aminopeptidase [Macrococcoides canis]|uniref:Aminopeptidase 2 n=1 Tax=Macrococcoides canis TaxID=1855823 RepID=A0A1W7ADE6_9STAP|nr:aminopeptidase [Macrococcus canis]ARQ07647.1 Aminopeptidase 2 [Macrococcus canis]MCO4097564.1 aminopeptidase [Macrococcus canis]QIH76589.1 aminopeptidase [Macrococcus canis]UTH06402.1 aminopeptidase [Macrococcus canis]UTH08736.1 aminopeptidase [Macrococcus canis]
MYKEEQLKQYAALLVKVGMNVQPEQRVYIRATVDAKDFVHLVVEAAYEAGASDVKVNYTDDKLAQLNFKYRNQESFESVPQYLVDERMDYANDYAAQLALISSSPENLKDADPKKVSANMKAYGRAFKDYMKMMQSDQFSWTVAAYPSTAWAKLVFPDLDETEAFEKLLDAILDSVRMNSENPEAAWTQHNDNLHSKADYLNNKKYVALRYKAPGTDLEIGLPEGHIWCGASSVNKDGTEFMANMPTEEVFTVPHKDKVNGYVSSTLPLSYGGNIIDNFKLTFKDGKVVDFEAQTGQDILEGLLNTDDAAKYLGEVALVPHDSPISNSKILYYNTLFDENASCHLALGSAYPFCLEGGKELDESGLAAAGLNNSITHEDFMIGSAEMNIYGVTSEGNEEEIFLNGNWAF